MNEELIKKEIQKEKDREFMIRKDERQKVTKIKDKIIQDKDRAYSKEIRNLNSKIENLSRFETKRVIKVRQETNKWWIKKIDNILHYPMVTGDIDYFKVLSAIAKELKELIQEAEK